MTWTWSSCLLTWPWAMDLPDLVVDADADIRAMLRALARARSVREVFIINGQEPGNLSRAL